jgi:hypothetical protein
VEEIPARDKSAEQGKRKKKNGGMGKMLLTQVERARKRREMKGIPHPVEQVEFSYLFELEKKSRQIS